MFGFSKKNKDIKTQDIKAFNWAKKAIEAFILLSEWAKARKALEEITFKENEWLNKSLNKIKEEFAEDSIKLEKEKKKKIDIFNKREKQISKLRKKLDILEAKYIDNLSKERFKIRFKKIKIEINNLIWNDRSIDAMSLLKKFLEENKENSSVIDFYNSEKKKVIANIEKQRKKEQEKIRKNTREEALALIWRDVKIKDYNDDENIEKEPWIIWQFRKSINYYKNLKEKIRKKKILEEVILLIEEDSQTDMDIKREKLENVHKWLIKELNNKEMIWYDIYGKILWADKISGDTFGLEETKEDYIFFIWDATGHWIKAGFIITILNKILRENIAKKFEEIIYLINNWLKQDLSTRNFITWIFYKISKKDNSIDYIGMWHEPMFIYRKNEKKVEKVIWWWIAWWIRLIKSIDDVKSKNLKMNQWDIILVFSDGIVENKWINGEYYGMDKLTEAFATAAENQDDIKIIYDYILNDVKLFKWSGIFWDDATMILLKREEQKDIVKEDDAYLEEIKKREGLMKKDLKKMKWKRRDEVEKEVEDIRKKKEIARIVKSLENLWYTWEVLKLKEEAIRFIKKWFIDKKINFFLKKAIDNEKTYKLKQKNQKLQIKYNILNELLKKWDAKSVINEIEDIISKDWNV